MTTLISFHAIDNDELHRALASGTDHGGHPIEPFVDEDGGWTLRCCLTNSQPRDRIAIIAWSPFEWDGPYREVGPLVVHADGCTGANSATPLPDALDSAPMVLRPYSRDRRIAYDHVRHVAAGGSLTAELESILSIEEVDFVHARNVTGGCLAFTARRATNG